MQLTKLDCDFYLNVLKRYLIDERRYDQFVEYSFNFIAFRPCLLINALRCFSLLLTRTSYCQLTSDFLSLIQPLIHIPIYESVVLDILSEKNLSLTNLLVCSSMKSFEYLFNWNQPLSDEEEQKFIRKFLPDLVSSYRNNEHDLTIFFSACSPESTWISSWILMKLSSFDLLPKETWKTTKKCRENEFDQIELEWSRLKLLIPLDQMKKSTPLSSDLPSKTITCELNLITFKSIIEMFDRNTRFLQQLKDKHLVSSFSLHSCLNFISLG